MPEGFQFADTQLENERCTGMVRISNQKIEERKRLLACYLMERSPCRGSVMVPLASMAADLGLSLNELRCVIRHLQKDEMLKVEHRCDPDGTQRANAYWITPRGKRFAGTSEA